MSLHRCHPLFCVVPNITLPLIKVVEGVKSSVSETPKEIMEDHST